MRKLIVLFAVFQTVLSLTGCICSSYRLDLSRAQQHQDTMPVKFRYPIFLTQPATDYYPLWFRTEQISLLTENLKKRSPELFSEDNKAFLLRFQIDYSKKNKRNDFITGLHALICLCSVGCFPLYTEDEHTFGVSIKIGNDEYVKKEKLIIEEREYACTIPIIAFLFPSLPNHFCRSAHDCDDVVNSAAFQNAFLNMIYSLDKDKLRKMYDERYGEPVQLLEETPEIGAE